MYSCARQTSQGTQRIHSVKSPMLRNNSNTRLGSITPRHGQLDFDFEEDVEDDEVEVEEEVEEEVEQVINDDDIINKYTIDTDNNDTPHYCSNSLINTMRTISCRNDDEEEMLN
jgi:hypothetical protein